jgi:hypothetical protein
MHSFQPSRGRVLFDFACALGMVVSCVGAWKQTGASALLAAASVAGLYGLVRLLDLARPKPTEAVEPQRIDFEPDIENREDLPAIPDVVVPFAIPDEPAMHDVVVPFEVPDQPATASLGAEEAGAEPAAAKAKSGSRAKTGRKGGGRRASAPKEAKATEKLPAETAAIPELALPEEAEMSELGLPEEWESAAFPPSEEPAHPHIAPLFEPEPFARMPRRAFGRRGRL